MKVDPLARVCDLIQLKGPEDIFSLHSQFLQHANDDLWADYLIALANNDLKHGPWNKETKICDGVASSSISSLYPETPPTSPRLNRMPETPERKKRTYPQEDSFDSQEKRNRSNSRSIEVDSHCYVE